MEPDPCGLGVLQEGHDDDYYDYEYERDYEHDHDNELWLLS